MERGQGIRVVAEIPSDLSPTRARTAGFRRGMEVFHERTEIINHPTSLFRLTRATYQEIISEALAWDDLT